MKTYSIIAKTNSYIANRDLMFNGSTEVVLRSNLSLKKAHSILLDMFNEYYSDKRGYAVNWGLAVCFSRDFVEGAVPTFSDGTRSFSYDSRTFSIIEEIHTYCVNDSESGNWILYEGTDKEQALAELINASEDGTEFDLYIDGDRVWCGKFNSISELSNI